jgi:hypothetical protein
MTTEQNLLWVKIKNFKFDKPRIKLTFKQRLMRENGFSNNFAEELLLEYKKFVFLCSISERQITPSHYIDIVWHLHLTYTKSYWLDLCRDTLEKDLHHNPTEGGKKENQKYGYMYDDTLTFYEAIFNQKPPIEIWQNKKERFEMTLLNVDKTQNWIIPKPRFSSLNFKITGLIAALFILLGCTQTGMSNDSLVLLFVGVFIVTIIIFIIKRASASISDGGSGGGSSSGCSSGSDITDDDGGDGDADSGSDSSDGGGDSGCGGGCGGGGD